MDEHEQFLTEVLQKTASIIKVVDEKYHEAAFPIILQAFIDSRITTIPKISSRQSNAQQDTQDLRLPPSMSINEFFRNAAPNSHPARFICSAYYLLHTGKKEQFTQADVVEIYGKLREPKPKNFADVINQCIKKVHIIDAPSSTNKQKSWTITPDGEKYVEELLSDNTNSKRSTS
jgi:hypothetical protein